MTLLRPKLRHPLTPQPLLLPALLSGLLLCGCSNVPVLPGLLPYKIEIQQGNFVSQEMVSRLKSGMTRDQVRFVMGTPLLMDVFHADRWDYIYTRVPERGGPAEQRRLAVFFQDDKLLRVEGDVVPQGGGAVPGSTAPGAAASPAAAAVQPR